MLPVRNCYALRTKANGVALFPPLLPLPPAPKPHDLPQPTPLHTLLNTSPPNLQKAQLLLHRTFGRVDMCSSGNSSS
jgi:hypothetical protein